MGSIFTPPKLPPIRIPWIAERIDSNFVDHLSNTFNLAYYRGVFDGLIAGLLIGVALSIFILVLIKK